MRPAYIGLRSRGGQAGTSRGAKRNPVVCGRRFCCGCGRWRHACDFWRGRDGGPIGRCATCQRVREREYAARRTPEQRELRNEYLRIWTDAKRRERGVRRNTFRAPRAVDRVERIFLPPGPLRRALAVYEAAWAEEHDRSGPHDTRGGGPWGPLAARSGVPDRTIYRVRFEAGRVQLDVADKLATALGVPLALLYPEPEAAAA